MRTLIEIITDLQTAKMTYETMKESIASYDVVHPMPGNKESMQIMQKNADACEMAIEVLQDQILGMKKGETLNDSVGSIIDEISLERPEMNHESTVHLSANDHNGQ